MALLYCFNGLKFEKIMAMGYYGKQLTCMIKK